MIQFVSFLVVAVVFGIFFSSAAVDLLFDYLKID